MKKERNLTKERTMKQRYAFMVKAKDDALNSLIQIGKKWGVFRYVMIGFLFIFLLTYHVFYNLFIQCKVHDKLSRALAYTMVFVMVFTSIGLTSIAADPYAVEPVAATDKYETISIDASTLNGSTIYGDGDTEFTLDKDGGFYSSKWRSSGCLPDSGRITVGSVPYQFTWTGNAPYAGKDSIRLSSASPVNTTSKTMVLKQYGVYDKIYILGTAAGFANENSSLSFTVDLNYSDGHSTHTTYTLGDWYRNSAISNSITLYTGLYRKDATYDASKPNGYVVSGHGPRLQSMAIECDETRLLSSIKFTMNTQTQTSGSTTYYLYSGIYAVTGKVSDNAPTTPALYEVTDADITSNSFTASWEAANNATNYYLDIATDALFSSMLPEYNNKAVGNVTEYKAEGLTEGTTYYYRVRSGNNAGQSLSSTAHTVVPRFKNLPAPVLAYENTVLVGEETYLQTVSWEAFEAAGNYRWSVEVTDESNAVSTYSGDLTQPGGDGSVYVVAEGSKYWLNITNLIDGIGSYKVSVVADPVENSDEYISSNTVFETVNIVYPSVTVDVTDELKASGIVSGIGGACVKAITNGVLSLTAENANAYSELGTWYESGEVFDTGVSTSLTADTQYVDSYMLIFDINREKLELVADEEGNYTLKLLEDVELEEDLVFGEDIILDLNGNNITTNTDAVLEVNDVILRVKNGQMTDATEGTENLINTIANGVVIVEDSVVMGGLVGGNAEVSWLESNGDKHYATIKDALTGGEGKEAEDNSNLSLIRDVELTEDTTIPENITMLVPDGKELSVPENVTLRNEGSIETNGSITNAGIIANTGLANWKNEGVVANTTTGVIYNDGSMDNGSGQIDNAGIFDGEGTIVNENGVINSTEGILQNQISNDGQIISEASWNEDGKKYYGPMDEAFNSAANNTDEEVTITVEKDMSMDENVTIPEHVTLEIPEDVTLTVPEGVVLDNNGEIVESGTLEVNGDLESEASWTDGETKHYSDFNSALDKVQSGEGITLLEDIIWNEDEVLEIPENVDLVIPNDVVLEIEKDKLGNSENIKSETSWENDGASDVIKFGGLEDAIEESASNPENQVDILIRDDVVVGEDLTIPENTDVTIGEDTSLTIPEDVVVENNGNVKVNGDLVLEGTLNTDATWEDGESEFYGTFEDAMDVVSDEDSDVTDIKIVGDVVLKEDVVIPEDVNITIDDGAKLTVPEGKELENNGNIINNGTMANEGKISNNKEIVNEGLVEGDGSIANSETSKIVTNDGIIKNQITDENGEPSDAGVESEAVLTNPETGEKYYGGLEGVLDNAEAGDEVKLNKDEVSLKDDIAVPEDVTLEIPEGSTLIVPEGSTLENNGRIENNSDTGIVINEGSAINNGMIGGTGSIKNNDGYLDLTEGITNNVVESTENADVKSEATWVIGYEVYRGSLEKALEEVANNGGGYVTNDTPSLDLEESIVIPPSVSLIVPEDTVVNIKDGVTVDNNGKIVSNGEIKTEGTGQVESDANWKDAQGKTTYGSMDDLLEEMAPDENGESDITEVTITGVDVELPSGTEEIIIPEGIKFEIAEDASLTIPEETVLVNKGEMIVSGDIGGEGTIDNAEGTIQVDDGAIETEFEEGKEGTLKGAVLVETENGNYYTSLEEAIKDSNANKVTLLEDITLEEDLSIPESLTLVIPEDVKVTLGQDVVLDNRGTIENSGHVDCGNGFIEGNLLENSETGTPNDLVAWKSDDQTTYYTTFENALDRVEEGDRIIFTNDMVMTQDVEIPENVTLEIPEDVELTINPGVVLQNNGTIDNNGSISNEGVIDNMSGTAIGGEIGGDGDINAEAVWTKNGETYYGSMEEGIESVEETGGTITLHNDNVLIDDELVIPPGVTLEIPEGKKVVVASTGSIVNDGTVKNDGAITNNGYIVGDGTINNDNGSINSVNGVVSNMIENGENGVVNVEASWEVGDVKYYGSLEKALESIETLGTETITITNDIIIKNDIEIPEGVILDIQPGVTVKIDGNASLTNKGTIVNSGIIGNAGNFVNDGNVEGDGALVDMKPQNKPSHTPPSDDKTKEDEVVEDEVTEDDTLEDEVVEEPSEEESSEEAEDETTDDETTEEEPSDIESSDVEQPEEDDATGDVVETVKGVIEDREFFEEEHVEAEVRIQEVVEAKKETQITATTVNFEELPDMLVTEDVNVLYGQGEISIVIETMDKEGTFDKGMYESVILSEVKAVVNACLTEEEQAKVENGAAAEIRLVIQVAPQKIASEDVVKVEEFVARMASENATYDVAGHVDISIEKNVDGQDWKKVSKLGEEIDIRFEIPADMQVENATYCVLRVHNGEPTLLEDLDDEESTITIRTQLFSTYSILYEKEETGSNILLIVLSILLVAGFMVVWFVRNRRKED